MGAPVGERRPGGDGLAPAFAAVRARLGLVAALFALAAVGWWWTVRQMSGMDEGSWTGLGTIAFLLLGTSLMGRSDGPSVNTAGENRSMGASLS